ncbi:hypothetical protein BH10PSE12_BH10PSE12_02510 [soil metagenome]
MPLKMISIDVEPRGQAYVNPDHIVGVVQAIDESGSWILLTGGHKLKFPGDPDQAYVQIREL